MNKIITGTLFVLSIFISFGCSKADLKFTSLKSKSGGGSTQTAPPSFEIGSGTADLTGGGYKLRGKINSKQHALLIGGGYKIYGEIAK